MKRICKITKADIMNIKPGRLEVFILDSPKAVRSAVTYAYQLAADEDLPEGVLKYTTKADYKNRMVVISAVAKKEIQTL